MLKAQIIGIAVGVTVPVVIVICYALLFWTNRRRKKQSSVESLTGSTGNNKDIILSPKQILGLDDDTYLTHLPVNECKTPHLPADHIGLTIFLKCLQIHCPLQFALLDM